jgi:hypothetical protein
MEREVIAYRKSKEQQGSMSIRNKIKEGRINAEIFNDLGTGCN